MSQKFLKQKRNQDSKCLTLGSVWDKAKELAEEDSRSVSSFLRELIKDLHQKKKASDRQQNIRD